jgi:hypothetical protein
VVLGLLGIPNAFLLVNPSTELEKRLFKGWGWFLTIAIITGSILCTLAVIFDWANECREEECDPKPRQRLMTTSIITGVLLYGIMGLTRVEDDATQKAGIGYKIMALILLIMIITFVGPLVILGLNIRGLMCSCPLGGCDRCKDCDPNCDNDQLSANITECRKLKQCSCVDE